MNLHLQIFDRGIYNLLLIYIKIKIITVVISYENDQHSKVFVDNNVFKIPF